MVNEEWVLMFNFDFLILNVGVEYFQPVLRQGFVLGELEDE